MWTVLSLNHKLLPRSRELSQQQMIRMIMDCRTKGRRNSKSTSLPTACWGGLHIVRLIAVWTPKTLYAGRYPPFSTYPEPGLGAV